MGHNQQGMAPGGNKVLYRERHEVCGNSPHLMPHTKWVFWDYGKGGKESAQESYWRYRAYPFWALHLSAWSHKLGESTTNWKGAKWPRWCCTFTVNSHYSGHLWDHNLLSVIARVHNSRVQENFYFKPYLQKGSHVCSFSLTPVPFSDPLLQTLWTILCSRLYSHRPGRYHKLFLYSKKGITRWRIITALFRCFLLYLKYVKESLSISSHSLWKPRNA